MKFFKCRISCVFQLRTAVVSALIFLGAGQGSAEVVNNLEFLSILTDSLIQSKTSGIFPDSNGKLVIRGLENNEKVDWFFENRLVNVLKRQGAENLYLNKQESETDKQTTRPTDPTLRIIEYRVVRLGVEYFDDNSGGDVMQLGRKAVASFFLRILQPTSGRILLSEEVTGVKSDWINMNDQQRLEDPAVEFTQGVLYATGGSSKAMEALLLTGVSGVIVFLFYSLRSR